MLSRHTRIAAAGVVTAGKQSCLQARKLALNPPEERDERTFSPSSPASETILGGEWDLPEKTDTSSDYAMTFLPDENLSLPAQLYPWKEDSWRQPSAREIDALCLLWNGLLPDLPWVIPSPGICSWRLCRNTRTAFHLNSYVKAWCDLFLWFDDVIWQDNQSWILVST